MKWAMKIMVAATAVAAVGSVCAQEDCRAAEEKLSDMSVAIADAHATGDFAKAKPLLDKAVGLSREGKSSAKACGCEKVEAPLSKADSLLREGQELGGDFGELQDKLYAVIGQSELARRAAEACWRAKAAQQSKK